MSAEGLAGLRSSVGIYWRALREVGANLYPRVKFVRLAYERMKGLRALPKPIRSVIFVCRGNICRSPLAEFYFAGKAKEKGHSITAKSAGIETHPGKPAHTLAKGIARQHGISLERHATTPLYKDLLQQSDLVLVMEVAQKDRLAKLYPQEQQKVFVLGQFCKGGSLDIDDPYCGTQDDFRVCFERIRESCDRVIELIGERSESEAGVSVTIQE